MAKPEWGAKRTCHNCGARFYDLRREPIVCPVCSTVYDVERQPRVRRGSAVARDETPARPKISKAVVGDDLAEETVDAGDDRDQDTEDDSDDSGDGDNLDDLESEGQDLIEDTSDLGEDGDDIGEVMEHIDEDVEDKS